MKNQERLTIEYVRTADVIPYDKNPRRNDKAVDAVAASISQFGFDLDAIAPADGGVDAEEDEFDLDAEPETVVVKPGEVWQCGDHRLMVGDSTSLDDVRRLMAGGLADLVITDPPYNVAYEGSDGMTIRNDDMGDPQFRDFLKAAFANMAASLKPGGGFYVWHADSEGYNFRGACRDAGLRVRQCLVWRKNALVLGRQDYQWIHEPCLYGWKDGGPHSFYGDMSQTTVLDFDKPRKSELHPTMKPIALFAYLMGNSSKEGDVVLDLFGGSGTTMICAERAKRRARVMELDPVYAQRIVNRWEEDSGKKAVRAEASGGGADSRTGGKAEDTEANEKEGNTGK